MLVKKFKAIALLSAGVWGMLNGKEGMWNPCVKSFFFFDVYLAHFVLICFEMRSLVGQEL